MALRRKKIAELKRKISESSRVAKRYAILIDYHNNNLSIAEIVKKHKTSKSTVYRWLTREENEGYQTVFHERPRKGRPQQKAESTKLTTREKEILTWLSLGKTSWETSQILGLSEHTVNQHINNMMLKTDSVNRVSLVATAIRDNLIA